MTLLWVFFLFGVCPANVSVCDHTDDLGAMSWADTSPLVLKQAYDDIYYGVGVWVSNML